MLEGESRNERVKWLAQQLQEKDAIINGISDALMLLDARTYRILEVNQAFLSSYGATRSEVLNKKCYDVTHNLSSPCHHTNILCPCPMKDTVYTGKPSQAEHAHLDHDGKTLYFEIITYPLRDTSGHITRIIHLSRDITLRKHFENEYHKLALQTEKLSALGRMAAGIAHEINNPLTGILLFGTNLRKKVPKDGPFRKGLDVIVRETQRCKGIIQDLLEFSRDKKPEKALASINDIVEKALSILDNEFRLHHISVKKNLTAGMPNTLLDSNLLQQVFVNLLINAVEAIQENGVITIKSYVSPDKRSERIEISDTGCGIPPEDMGKVFEPFFSTKSKGTGLGLAVSYGIVQKHQGDIQVSSQPGQGTRFTIEIPIAQGSS
ncbi:MAG: PAS domain-containing protein [Desulfobacteraceae bacterium]|nr:MAG: PAS domain-containing protein [Desulfobacteraceae bacterium]